jgi:hypothetical protein
VFSCTHLISLIQWRIFDSEEWGDRRRYNLELDILRELSNNIRTWGEVAEYRLVGYLGIACDEE